MKLNNHTRDLFVNNVIKAIPRKHKLTSDQAAAEIEALAQSLYPASLKKFIKQYPTAVYRKGASFRVDSPSKISGGGMTIYASFVDVDETKNLPVEPVLQKVRDHLKENEELIEYKSRLRQIVYGCSTQKQLAEALPELARFIPGQQTSNTALALVGAPDLVKELKARGLVTN